MPEDKGFFTGATEALKLAVPLVIQKRRLDSVESRFQQKMELKRSEILQEGIEAHDKIQADFIIDKLNVEMEKFQFNEELSLDKAKLTQKTNQESDELEFEKQQEQTDKEQEAAKLTFNKLKLNTPKTTKPKDRTTENRMRAKDIAASEKKITEDKDFTQIDFFNQYAKKPYVYTVGEGKSPWHLPIAGWEIPLTGEAPEPKQIKLPKYQGKQVYAEDVYQTMIDNDMTFEEVLREIGALK